MGGCGLADRCTIWKARGSDQGGWTVMRIMTGRMHMYTTTK